MFCRLGLFEDSRPVAAMFWWNVVWIRPVGEMKRRSVSMICRILVTSRWASRSVRKGWAVFSCRSISVSALVLYPVLVRRRSEEHTSELQSRGHLVCRLLLEKKNTIED